MSRYLFRGLLLSGIASVRRAAMLGRWPGALRDVGMGVTPLPRMGVMSLSNGDAVLVTVSGTRALLSPLVRVWSAIDKFYF